MSRATDLADLVVSALNTKTFSTPITARRVVVPEETLEGVQGVRCDVMSSSQMMESNDKNSVRLTISVEIRLIKAMKNTFDETKTLGALLDEIADEFLFSRVGGYFAESVEENVLAGDETIGAMNTFCGVVTCNFNAILIKSV